MKNSDSSVQSRPAIRWGGFALASLFAAVLVGCGGGGGGGTTTPAPVTSTTPTVPVPTGTAPIKITAATAPADFAALAPVVPAVAVSIGSGSATASAGGTEKPMAATSDGRPVVTFSVTDAAGNPIIGLGSKSQSATATVAGYPNLAFSIAKLVPGATVAATATHGAYSLPAKWVNYIVTTVPTYKSSTDKTIVASVPTRPTTDNTGTLVDNGNGTYTYTFYRDITTIKSQVDAAASTLVAPSNAADLGDLTYDPNAVHRITIQISGNAPGTGSNTPTAVTTVTAVPMTKPVDVIYDFIPATGKAVTVTDPAREVTATAKCEECHYKLGGIPGDTTSDSGAGFHGGSRNETRYCVVCHTEQRKFGRAEALTDSSGNYILTKDGTGKTTSAGTYKINGIAVGNFPNLIHKTHFGKLLTKTGYDFAGVEFNEVGFPQDARNCTKCHDGSASSTAKTTQGDNWMNVPNRVACGGCHDGINFNTGDGVTLSGRTTTGSGATAVQAHIGGAQPTDGECAICHTAAKIDVVHTPVTPPSSSNSLLLGGTNSNTNAAYIASNTNRLPAGAIKVTYDIKSVSRDATTKNPVMVFRMLQNGARKDLNVFDAAGYAAAAAPDKNAFLASKEIWDNYVGAPSVYFVFSVPQDGITAPADFNASVSSYLRSLWNGTASGTGAGTLTGPDADGYYTATLTGVKIPDDAKMLTGGLGFSYSVLTTLPLTQTNVAGYPVAAATATSGLNASMPNKTGGLIVIAPNVTMVATGYTARRPIVSDALCNKCHQELGTFTEDAFHAGQRNDGTTCSWCHTPNRTSSGWSADSTYFVHAIHAGNKRATPFNWHASADPTDPTNAAKFEGFNGVKFPGVLKNCEACHLSGTYDFSAATSSAAIANRLYRYVGSGAYPDVGVTPSGYTAGAGTCTPKAGTSTGSTLSVFSLSPQVTKTTSLAMTDYGVLFTANFSTTTAVNGCRAAGTAYQVPVSTATTTGSIAADASTLVISPITTACFACHDSTKATTHMENNGGSIYRTRAAALAKPEICMDCHVSTDKYGLGIKAVHAIK